jgi:hypothetical protein
MRRSSARTCTYARQYLQPSSLPLQWYHPHSYSRDCYHGHAFAHDITTCIRFSRATFVHNAMAFAYTIYISTSRYNAVATHYSRLPHHLLFRLRSQTRSARVTSLSSPPHHFPPKNGVGVRLGLRFQISYAAACAQLPTGIFPHARLKASGSRNLSNESALRSASWHATQTNGLPRPFACSKRFLSNANAKRPRSQPLAQAFSSQSRGLKPNTRRCLQISLRSWSRACSSTELSNHAATLWIAQASRLWSCNTLFIKHSMQVIQEVRLRLCLLRSCRSNF